MKNIYRNSFYNLNKAKRILEKNQILALPTETVYGLAGNAYSHKSVKRIYSLKKRPQKNPLIIHYYNLDLLKKDAEYDKNFIKLYKKFSPGPITFVIKLRKSSKISKLVTNKQNTLAVRFPKHPLFRKLLKQLSYPLAAPSANISSRLSSVKASDVSEEFGSKVKFILNGGRSQIGIESTIISLIKEPTILRLGGIDIARIRRAIKKKVLIKINSKKKIVPGQSHLHYSPGIPLRINVKKPLKGEAFVLIKKRKISYKNYFYLSKNNNLKHAAKNLYSLLRKIKKDGYKMIAVEKIRNSGIGKSINDRLIRASKF